MKCYFPLKIIKKTQKKLSFQKKQDKNYASKQ